MFFRDFESLSQKELADRLRYIKHIHNKVPLSAKDGSPRAREAALLTTIITTCVYIATGELLFCAAAGLTVYVFIMRYSRLPTGWHAQLCVLISRLEPLWSSPLRELRTGNTSWSFAERCLQQEMDLILTALRYPADRINA